ncbi:hypothetical protein ILUMI_21830 [Ignelater luminosus]|uniref:Uncharacterized protein n=1 Tax=Ignelater luminosus TaxID=2038154 RepID=A0A8K0FXP5_IGNLU|nr:hypothetical protein ILUMI_21830 [Ignelater luminosus]
MPAYSVQELFSKLREFSVGGEDLYDYTQVKGLLKKKYGERVKTVGGPGRLGKKETILHLRMALRKSSIRRVYKAARHYKIPHNRLKDRLKVDADTSGADPEIRLGRPLSLTAEEEQLLVICVLEMQQLEEVVAGWKWWDWFKEWYGPSMRLPENLSMARVAVAVKESVAQFYINLEAAVAKYGLNGKLQSDNGDGEEDHGNVNNSVDDGEEDFSELQSQYDSENVSDKEQAATHLLSNEPEKWYLGSQKQNTGRQPQRNVKRQESGPTRYANRNVDTIWSTFCFFFRDTIINYIVQWTNAKGKLKHEKLWKNVDDMFSALLVY